ncbi:hypothetical protein Rcae01_06310 [Novipirellula caenicola]|uniref:Transposase n=1 Tax=Novipirellula caenicola TaxID=1536901 RepID=A0ABP9W2Q8_9BACT
MMGLVSDRGITFQKGSKRMIQRFVPEASQTTVRAPQDAFLSNALSPNLA